MCIKLCEEDTEEKIMPKRLSFFTLYNYVRILLLYSYSHIIHFCVLLYW